MKTLGKSLLGILALLVVAIGILYVISPDATTVHIETEIDAPAEEVWAALAHEFAEIDKWSSTVESSRVADANEVPSGWTIDPDAPIAGRETASPAGTFREFFIDYSEEEMDFTFRADGLPSIITKMTDRQQVIPLDENRSKVTFDVEMQASGIFKALGPILSSRFASTFGLVQEELKAYVESGQAAQ
ncbi:MAG: SRPBCC family protein [Chloroflexota bacterium]